MSTKTLKSIVGRGSMLGAVFALVVATVLPAASAYADALNPLTERSLMLSSSAPGFMDSDGSGNSEGALNANEENFAPPGSGPNGKKTGETFTFKVSSDSSTGSSNSIQAFTLQYCTTAAGYCQAPGDNNKMTPDADSDGIGDGDFRNGAYDADTNADGRPTNAEAHPLGHSDLNIVDGWTEGPGAGQFQVLVGGTPTVPGTPSTGWTMKAVNAEDDDYDGPLTGTNNMIKLMHTGAGNGAEPEIGDRIQLVFKASTSKYITNPGSDSFFVKINTYDSQTETDLIPDVAAADNEHIIDGGVTVANVMTDSIHITTKVLETMSFSVGTKNRDTKVINCAVSPGTGCEGVGSVHGPCDPIQTPDNNRLNLGNPNAEYSLETDTAWDVYSYWRLSSNSSGGATVYYSGNTLANTVGDEIAEMDTEALSTPGMEQFGLGFVDAGDATQDPRDPALNALIAAQPTRYKVPSAAPFTTLSTDPIATPAQTASLDYDEATGDKDDGAGHQGTAKFKFLKSSLTVPEPIAQQNEEVISCATAKMRYVANIGADTPAGVYTTKINYLAAPQY